MFWLREAERSTQAHWLQGLWISSCVLSLRNLSAEKRHAGVFDGEGIKHLTEAPELEQLTVTQLERDLLIEGYLANKIICEHPR